MLVKNSQHKKDRFKQLRSFCAVYEEGSIRKAADKLFTSASNVSVDVSSLEKEIGIELFSRHIKNKLVPTNYARRVYVLMKDKIECVEEFYSNTKHALKDEYSRTLKIAAHFYALSHLLPEVLAQLMKQDSNIKLDINNTTRADAIQMLKKGEVDIIIFPIDEYDDELIIEDLYKATPVLAMSKDHPLTKIKDEDLTWEEITKHKMGYIDKNVTMQGLINNIKKRHIKNNFSIKNGTWDIGRNFVKNGLCIGFFEANYLNDTDKLDIVTKNTSHLLPDYSFQYIIRKGNQINIATQEFIALLKKSFPGKKS